MAVVEETIGSGKDRATIALWESNVGSFGTDIYKGIIQQDAEFDESVTLAGGAGTPSITSYLWLTTDPANRHAGVAGTGHGRVRNTTASSNCFDIEANFTRIDWLEIEQGASTGSEEGIRVTAGTDDVLIDYCIIWTESAGSSQDGIYTGDWDVSNLRISNSSIYGWDRGCIHIQQFSAGTARTITLNVDHCALADTDDGSLIIRSEHASDSITIGLYNTWGTETVGNQAFIDGTPTGTVTWNGSNNCKDYTGTSDIGGTNNLTSWQEATDGWVATTKSTGAWIVVNSITAGSEDLTLLDDEAGNLVAGNGTDRQGSEPDARQDFSVDITGGARSTSTVDIGSHNVSAASAPIDLTLLSSTTFYSPTLADSSVDLTLLSSTVLYAIIVDDLTISRTRFYDLTVETSTSNPIDLDLLSSTTFPTLTVADSSFQLATLSSTVLYSTFLDGNVDLDLLSSTAFFSPQLDGSIDLTLLSSTVIYSPQLDGEVLLVLLASTTFPSISLVGIIDLTTLASTVFYTPQLDGTIDLDLLNSTTFYSNLVVFSDLTMDLLSSTVFYSPQLDGEILLTLLDASATFPSIDLLGIIDLTFLDASVTFFSPQLDGNIDLTNLSSTVFYAIKVSSGFTMDLLSSTTFPTPVVGASSIDLTSLNSTVMSTTFAVVSLTEPLEMDLLDASPTFPTPSVVGIVALTHLASTAFFAPQLDGNIDLDLLSSTSFPSITVGEASIDLDTLSSTTLYSTNMDGNIDLDALSNTIVYSTTVSDSSIDLDLLNSTVLYSITVIDPAAGAVGIQLPMRGVDR